MKKRRLTIAVLALLTALLLVLPVVAESTLGNVDAEKPPEETEALAACDHEHGSEVTLQDTAFETETVCNHMKVGNLVFVETKYGKWVVPACTHTKTITYFDTDTGESGHICAKCGYTEKYEDKFLSVSKADIVTSVAIRNNCNHVYSGWGRISSTQHQRTCTLCGHDEPADHVRVNETCTLDEHCRDCGTHEDGWDEAFDHHMVWSYDWLMEEYGDYHDYRCDNSIPGIYDCGHVQIEDQPCAWSIWYYTAAVNGVHTEHRECVLCGIWSGYEEYPCTIDTGYCYYCRKVNY